jgi:hypothetical protein
MTWSWLTLCNEKIEYENIAQITHNKHVVDDDMIMRDTLCGKRIENENSPTLESHIE